MNNSLFFQSKHLFYSFFTLFSFCLFSICSCTEEVPPTLDEIESPIIGQISFSLEHDQINREYILYVPEGYDETTAVPLLFNFHGYGGEAADFISYNDMKTKADEENFILVYPQDTDLEGWPHWNAGLTSKDNKSSVDDFGFIEALIQEISDTYSIDTKKVYACGYSNGGFMSFALACFKSDLFAAVGSISGTMLDESYNDCTPSHPTPIIILHGTQDNVVPYNGSFGLTSIVNVVDYWTDFNQTSSENVDNSHASIDKYTYSDGNNGASVELYKINGGEHVWFKLDYNGKTTADLLWDFFSQYNIDGKL